MSTTLTESLEQTSPPAAASPSSRVVTQTIAMFADAYRELNARKMFWITLLLSGLVVAVFAVVGFYEEGFTVGWKKFPSIWFNTRIIPKDTLYKTLFVSLGVDKWLTWLAMMLAVASTAGLMPDFLAGGSIDLYLSKPMGRLRLFMTKYVTGLTFVALQVTIFCVASYFVMGLRGGVWTSGVFVAIPFVVLFFSYLFCFSTLVSILTRSTLATLLLTMLFWIVLFGLDTAEKMLLALDTSQTIQARDLDRQIGNLNNLLTQLGDPTTNPTASPTGNNDARRSVAIASLAKAKKDRAELQVGTYTPWHRLAYWAKWPLPKTGETYHVIERSIQVRIRLGKEYAERDPSEVDNRGFFRNERLRVRTAVETDQIVRSRPLGYILGTSLGFEAVILGVAAWIFCRRDF